jgi:hypothetical protein
MPVKSILLENKAIAIQDSMLNSSYRDIWVDRHSFHNEEVEMKRKMLLSNCLLAAAILVLCGIAPVQAARNAAASEEKLITILNPAVTEKLAERVPLTPRLDTLEGKTIYLVDMNYEGIGGTPVMGEMQAWFAKNMPGVKAILKLKSGSYIADDPALWKEIAANKGNGVIIGVAG